MENSRLLEGGRIVTRPIRRVALRVANATRSARGKWRHGLRDEAAYWADWAKTGGKNPEMFAYKLDAESPLMDYVVDNLPDGDPLRLLDVGAGPATLLGKTTPGRTLEVFATDALADEYNAQLRANGITPPVETKQCETEQLTTLFEPESFDVVHARNTLDHHYDPRAAIEQIALVTKPGGSIIFLHAENEAERAHYNGLHQFNFAIHDDKPVMWNRRMELDLDDFLGHHADRVFSGYHGGAADRRGILIVYRKRSVA